MKTNWKSVSASVAVCVMPLIHYLYVVIFWLLASAVLGHWAQPGVDDPKSFFFGAPAVLGVLLMLLSFAVVPIVAFLGYRRGRLVSHLIAYGISLVLSICLFRLDLLQITTWIAD